MRPSVCPRDSEEWAPFHRSSREGGRGGGIAHFLSPYLRDDKVRMMRIRK